MIKIKGYPLLNNVPFLYFIVFLFMFNLGIFIYIKDNQSIFLIAFSALLVYIFNNNMIIVLLLSMLIVNSLIVINILNSKKEGFEEPIENENDKSISVGDPPEPNPGTDYSTPSKPGTTLEGITNEDKALNKKINAAIGEIKNSSEKLNDKLKDMDPDLYIITDTD